MRPSASTEPRRPAERSVAARPRHVWRRTFTLAVAGALGFWVANLAISLTPVAAEYRSALSIDYAPMLLESLVGGVIIGLCVAYLLVRFPDRIPPSNPALKALTLSLVALIAVTLLVEAPTKLLATSQDPLRYFLTATAFNALRLLALGAVVGACNSRLVSRDRADATGHRRQNPASGRRGLGNRRYGSDSGLRGVTPHGGPRSPEGQTMDAGQPGARQRNTRGADGDHAQG